MEIIGIIIFIGIVWAVVAGIVEKRRQGIRDKIAHEVLDQTFNFEKEKAEILAINQNLNYVKTENRCPSCNGILVTRRGTYGAFLGCSNYPKCHFTRQTN